MVTRTKGILALLIGIVLALGTVLGLVPREAMANDPTDPVSYMAWDDGAGELVDMTGEDACTSYTVVDGTNTAFADGGWYVVSGSVTYSNTNRIVVTGTANLILCDNAILTANAGIEVAENNTLNIYAQSTDKNTMGVLAVTRGAANSAGIGGGNGGNGGTVNIYGGKVTAKGARYSAGIGGGNGGSGGTVSIYGGEVTATGHTDGGAGIGGGAEGQACTGGDCGTVTIYGGTVTATGGTDAAGIGSGSRYQYDENDTCGTIAIYGGEVTATGANGGAGIGGGRRSGGADVTINGGEVTATGGSTQSFQAVGIGAGYYTSALDDGTLHLGAGVSMQVSADNTEWASYDGSARQRYMKSSYSPHTHSFTYEASDATITATCANTDGNCPLDDGTDQHNHIATLTIEAPTLTTYGQTGEGISAEAIITDDNGIRGESTVSYYATDNNGNKSGSELGAAPTDAGTYWAEITLGAEDNTATAHVVYTIAKEKEAAPENADAALAQLTISYTEETVTAKNGYEVAADEDGTAITNFSTLLDSSTDAPTVYVRKAATDQNHDPSDWAAVTINGRPDAPTTEFNTINATNGSTTDGEIEGTGDAMEYKLKGSTGGWTTASNDKTVGLAAGTYLIRFKATDSAFASKPAEVTVGSNYTALDDSTPVTVKKGDAAIGDTAPVVGDALTVSCGATDLVFEWFVDGTSQGAAAAGNISYTVKAADAGKTIVAKAYQTKNASGQDYAENERPSKESAATSAVVKKTPADLTEDAAKTNSGISYVAETVTPTDGFQVSSSNTEYSQVTSLTATLDGGDTPTIYVRRAETEDTAAGEWVAVALTARPNAPEGLTTTSATDGSATDGEIIGTSDSMQYKLKDGESEWTTATNDKTAGLTAGTYQVRTKATADVPASKPAEVTVESKEIALSDGQKPTAKTDLVYDGSKQELLNAPAEALPKGAVEMRYALGKDATNAPEEGWSTSIPTGTDADTYNVWYKAVSDDDHVDSKPACLTATIAKAKSTVTKAPAATNPTYNGKAQELVTAGTAEGGTMQYSSDGKTFSETIPTGTDAKAYTVWYRVVGDKNHVDSEAKSVTSTITKKDEPTPTPEPGAVALTGSGHVENVGDKGAEASGDGILIGSTGESKRLEAVTISLPEGTDGGIEYRAHVQNEGWNSWTEGGKECGSRGLSRRVEGVQVRLTGVLADTHSVWYRAHVQNMGWLGWAKDGEAAGSAGQSLRTEALEAVVLPEGQVPADYVEREASYVGAATANVHVQNRGWTGAQSALSFGTTGQSRRLEAIRLSVPNQPVAGGVEYEVHAQNRGWMPTVADGELAGTTGESLRLEAVRVRLTPGSELAKSFSVWYRVHSQNQGWLGWAHDGQDAGTEGLSLRAEAIDVQILPQGQVPRGYDASKVACVTR